MNLGERIAALRRKRNLSQAALAGILHVRQKTVAMWENGKNEPSLQRLREIANLMKADLQWLVLGKSCKEESNGLFVPLPKVLFKGFKEESNIELLGVSAVLQKPVAMKVFVDVLEQFWLEMDRRFQKPDKIKLLALYDKMSEEQREGLLKLMQIMTSCEL